VIDDDSLPDLLLAAFKVAIRDKRNVTIVVLSIFILLLALRPSNVVQRPSAVVMGSQMAPVVQVETTTVYREAVVTETIPVPVTTSIMVPIESPTKDAEPVEDPCVGRIPVKEVENQAPAVEVPKVVESHVPVKEAESQVPVVEIPEAVETQIPVQEVKRQIPAVETPEAVETPVQEAKTQIPAIEVQDPPENKAPLPPQELEKEPTHPSAEPQVVGETLQQPIAVDSEL
jgi:hypothetical protein